MIFCQGSGANTYANRREIDGKRFNYFDLFADEFCKLIFMGVSEGSTLIPFAAKECSEVAGLLLLGFSYENMREPLNWQLSGGSSIINMCKYFGCSPKGYIDRADFILDQYNIRPSLFSDIKFEDLDLDGDGKITEKDFALQLSDYRKQVFQAIEDNDDEWLRNHYSVQITSKWCKEHFALPAVSSAVCSLTIPIYIFQGEDDANIPISDIEKMRKDFDKTGRDNLYIFTFLRHDHDLNFLDYIFAGTVSEGLQCVFDKAQLI